MSLFDDFAALFSRKHGVKPVEAPDHHSQHPQALHGEKINFKRPRILSKIFRSGEVTNPISNHDRTITARAKRMGITTEEYKRRFCN